MKSAKKQAATTIIESSEALRVKAQRAAPGNRQVYCVDLAKNHFQVNRYSSNGELLSGKAMTRSSFQKLVDDPQRARALWVMEACGGAHSWGRQLIAKGDQAKLVPAHFVAKQRVGNKNDSNDTASIFAVHLDSRVLPVPVKSLAQQGQLAIHAARDQLVKSRTAMSNHLRGVLTEHGYVTEKGAKSLRLLVNELSEVERAAQMDRNVQLVMIKIHEMIMQLDTQIDRLEERIEEHAKLVPEAKQLKEVPGIGPITASAIVAEHPTVERFADARKFSASFGVTPGEHSTGGKTHQTGVTKRGNEYIRKLFVQGAHNVVNSACPKPNSKRAMALQAHPEKRKMDDLHEFVRQLMARKPRKVVVLAVANRMARIAYAILKNACSYRPNRPQPTPAAVAVAA